MGKLYEEINERVADFIRAQKMFFVGTAPLAGDGHVNLSPKGLDSLVITGPREVIWLDTGGSGIETLAHVKENSRMVLMFCAFEGKANILRLHGKARGVQFDEPEFPDLLAKFPEFSRARNIFVVAVTRIQDSCGWGVPLYDYQGQREQLQRYADNPDKSPEDWAEKYYTQNATSIDGLPGIERKG